MSKQPTITPIEIFKWNEDKALVVLDPNTEDQRVYIYQYYPDLETEDYEKERNEDW